MARLLLVEDNFALRRSLTVNLRGAGFDVTAVGSAEEAAEAVAAEPPDVVVLDWMLPGQSGWELLRLWRASGMEAPVVMLTARDAVADRVKGLDAGANDYIVKPFATEELVARLRVQLRSSVSAGNRLELTGTVVNLDREMVKGPAGVTPLTTKEAALLRFLAERPGTVVSRDELHREVWGYASTVVSRAADNTVLRLRAKIEVDAGQPRHLLTVHGTGYRFEL